MKKDTKCYFCDKKATYQAGVSNFKETQKQMLGPVCEEHVEEAINNLMSQCFGTTFWPMITDRHNNILYHSYRADQQGYAAVAGWRNFLQNQK